MTRLIPSLSPSHVAASAVVDEEFPGPKREHHVRIDADLLIPGRGDSWKDASVIMAEGKVAWVGKTSDLPSQYSSSPSTKVPVLMPGLWDCHVHFLGAMDLKLDALAYQHQALSGIRIAASAEKTLKAGFTSVREMLGYGVQLSKAIDEGSIVGPRIYSAVAGLSQSAGHGDLHSVPMSYLRDCCNHGLCICIADGVEECRKAVRMQIRAGAKVIKVMATGGVLSGIDSPFNAQYSMNELRVIVEEAERSGLVVGAHAHGKAGILQALHAGCKTIEHGTGVDEQVCHLMKRKGAILVATRSIVEELIRQPELMTPESYKKAKAVAEMGRKSYELAIKMGVKIALGTDTGVDRNDNKGPVHGKNGNELSWAVKAGMTPLQAIEAATAAAPATLGSAMAPKSGLIQEGYDADLIAISQNPLKDIDVLTDPTNVTHVWKDGKLFKGSSSDE